VSLLSVLFGSGELNQKPLHERKKNLQKNRPDARSWLLNSGWYRIKGLLAHGRQASRTSE